MAPEQVTRVSLNERPGFLALFQDAEFRQEFEADPVKALAANGVRLEASEVPEAVKLPEEVPSISGGLVWNGLF